MVRWISLHLSWMIYWLRIAKILSSLRLYRVRRFIKKMIEGRFPDLEGFIFR